MLLSEIVISGLSYHNLGPYNFRIAGGECVCVSGQSGAGKTLMLRALADIDPHTGSVALNGRESLAFNAPAWRQRVALLPAESQWWADTVGEHGIDASQGQLSEVGFEPDVLEWQISRLSTGERQRLAVVRLLARTPDVLLLDEPTANLDAQNAQRVETVLLSYGASRQAALLWVSHSPEQIRRIARRCLRFDGSRLLEEEVA